MFDKRLANLCDTSFDEDDVGGSSMVEGGDPCKWQPLTNVSGQLVERKRGERDSSSTNALLFNNVEIDRLIDNLQHSYQHQLSSYSSSVSPPAERNRNGSSSSSGGRHAVQSTSTHPVSPTGHKSSSSTNLGASNTNRTAAPNRNWRKEKLLARVDSLSAAKEARRDRTGPGTGSARDTRGSDPDLPKEHLDSLYEDLLDAVIAEIHDNQNFLEESCRHLGTSPPEAHYLPHPQTHPHPSRGSPPGAKASSGVLNHTVPNQAQVTSAGHVQRRASNPKSPKATAGGGGGGNFHLSSPSHINSMRSKREPVLNEHFEDQLLQVSLPDDLDLELEENAFNQSNATHGNIGIQMRPAAYPANSGERGEELEDLKTEDILSHPLVQSLLSEEKVKRWALLKSLYDREATLEKQIESLQTQLRDQTQLASHFKRMQQELITSHCEKENLWEKERQKLVDKLKSGQKKMVFCSKLILYLLEKDRKDKEEQSTNEAPATSNPDAAAAIVDVNKNEVYKYHILNDEDPSHSDSRNSFPFQSNFIFSQKPSLDTKNSYLSSYGDSNNQVYAHNHANNNPEVDQSELSIISESEALINHRPESAVIKNGAFSCSLNENRADSVAANVEQSSPMWNCNFVNTELAPLRKMVNNCRANAEKQCRMLRQMFPEASKSATAQKQFSSNKKETTKKLAKSFTFPHSSNGGNSSKESSDDGSDSEQQVSCSSHPMVLRSKSFSSSVGLSSCAAPNNRGSDPEMTSSHLHDNHHAHLLRLPHALMSGGTMNSHPMSSLSMSNSSHMSCSASAISEPPCATLCQDDLPTPCSDPFDLDLKVKYCSSENIMHAMQTCSLNSPLISPCSSFDEGLASGTSSHTALFGSGIIVSATTPNATNTSESPSPVHKTFAQATAPSVMGKKKHSVSNISTTTATDHHSASVKSVGGRTLSTRGGIHKQPSSDGAQELLACNVHNAAGVQSGSCEQEATSDPNESLMIFDSSNDSMNATCSVIKDFDPLDSQT